MDKNKIMDSMAFRGKCSNLGASWESFDIIDDVIAAYTPSRNVRVLFDEHYNIIGILDTNSINRIGQNDSRAYIDVVRQYKKMYENNNRKFLPPFNQYSLKQLSELASRINIEDVYHGQGTDITVNAELAEDEDSIYGWFLHYANFLGLEIEEYYKMLYQMKMLSLPCVDIYTYLYSIISCIDAYIVICLSNNIELEPNNLIAYMGQHISRKKYIDDLYGVIELGLYKHGFKWSKDFKRYVPLTREERNEVNVEDIARKALKVVLGVPQKEVDKRIKAYQENSGNLKTVSLEKMFSDGITYSGK